MDKSNLKRVIDVAAGRKPADLCIKNCRIIDVFNRTVFQSDLLVAEGIIAGYGGKDHPDANTIVDAEGAYIAPGLIDGHVHIESSHLSPAEFSRLVVPHGTTTVIADPHEICNVCGLDGFDYMLNATENIALSVFLQFPSCVPSTPFEHAGAVLDAIQIAKRISNPRVLGLGELMNFPGVCAADDGILDKLMVAQIAGKIVDGHSPGLDGYELDTYTASGVRNEHECATPEDLMERVRRGVYVMLRQGSTCHDLLNLLPAVNKQNDHMCLFCTDDRQSASLLEEGHIDNNVRLAVSAGLDPLAAICMATINAAYCFGLRDRGAVAPGRRADLIMFDDLLDIRIKDVWIEGKHVSHNGGYLAEDDHIEPKNVSGKMNVKDFSASKLKLTLSSDKVKTIKLLPYSVVTEIGHAKVKRDIDGNWMRDEQDIVKIAVIERHHGTGNVGVGLLEGFGLRDGAIATSVAHDSHNIIVAGDNDTDMEIAVKKLIEIGGGMIIVSGRTVIDLLSHEIAGLMTDRPGEEVAHKISDMDKLARKVLKINEYADPFMTLCFMALPVIPEMKITDSGLFDVEKFGFTDIYDNE
ncbi:MAG: adenine deaminase [Lachnospiraceae bacterium]|nr:adenine deaminase [Lachnospiraceae bacterium]